ncbi:hypothetical protein YH65_10755 [Sulfurovum lithotrophicum]|uniref:DUF2892 domain-containing protein n=2 Tax=Sulfurovum TaxID=265570 RepID=A0A7U4M2S2_9BACT|nr:YgaP-like transmembrane domain [Sulfurovum lithotrophicum]AKF25814.1 hypothetical protein YH65_10755 [Sulfurovum lithotrophicum]
MLCAERLQRLIQASILGFVLLFAALGIQGGERSMLQIAFLLQVAMMVMLVIAGLTGFCPGLKILKKIFPPCE